MLIKHHHSHKIYFIEAPSSARVSRSEVTGMTTLWIGDTAISEEPTVLLVRLAQAGKHGLRIVGSKIDVVHPQA
jgi:hypothetical protein